MGSNKNKWDLEKMQKFCDENALGYTVLDTKYIDKGYQKQQWALIKCSNPNHEPVWMWWNHFRKGERCKYCSIESTSMLLRKRLDEVENIFQEHDLMIDNIEDYKNVDECLVCTDSFGYKYFTNVSTLKKNSIPRKFNKNNPYSLYNLKLFCKLERPDYEVVSQEYLGIKENHIFKYNGDFDNDVEYDRMFECTVDCFANGFVEHPMLVKSSGERRIEKYLKENNIIYIPQKTFPDCKDKQVLPFDFYLPEYYAVIEFMGGQHEKPVAHWGGEKQLKLVQYHDKIKRDYLRDHNIPILDIWYYDFSKTENMIDNYLKNISSDIKQTTQN